ncbi:serine/threonine protein kinase [Hyalangium versicolor]|uniref:serine/threonine protein kinase n=1 Tax=Hyalangium versicolor TaxID=2861190 RepID=UPI001CCE2C0C|nr:protein kinase [Hyalangium versicolor]
MAAIEFKLPKGAILFSDGDGVSYEFREDLGEAHHGLSLFVARRRSPEGHPEGKVLLKAVGLGNDPEWIRVAKARAKLEEQVRLATYLQHPGILRVHGLHKTEAAWYVVTDHPTGQDLAELLGIVQQCDRWFSPFFAVYVGAAVASALEHAHSAKNEKGHPLGIVHRAIDLSHFFVDWEGRVQVSDFGLALSTLPGRVVSTVRRPKGDTYFASPEMLLGGRVDARSDLFALGLVMLEMATGKNLLDTDMGVSDAAKAALSKRQVDRVKRAIKRARLAGCGAAVEQTIWRAATYTPEDVEAVMAGLPEMLRTPLSKLLQRSKAARYQTAGELETDLRRWLGGQFGKSEAAAELKRLKTQAGEALIEQGLRRSRRRGQSMRHQPSW